MSCHPANKHKECPGDVCFLFKHTGVCCPSDSCDLYTGVRTLSFAKTHPKEKPMSFTPPFNRPIIEALAQTFKRVGLTGSAEELQQWLDQQPRPKVFATADGVKMREDVNEALHGLFNMIHNNDSIRFWSNTDMLTNINTMVNSIRDKNSFITERGMRIQELEKALESALNQKCDAQKDRDIAQAEVARLGNVVIDQNEKIARKEPLTIWVLEHRDHPGDVTTICLATSKGKIMELLAKQKPEDWQRGYFAIWSQEADSEEMPEMLGFFNLAGQEMAEQPEDRAAKVLAMQEQIKYQTRIIGEKDRCLGEQEDMIKNLQKRMLLINNESFATENKRRELLAQMEGMEAQAKVWKDACAGGDLMASLIKRVTKELLGDNVVVGDGDDDLTLDQMLTNRIDQLKNIEKAARHTENMLSPSREGCDDVGGIRALRRALGMQGQN